METACFRGGCLTGPNHSGAQLHGFLAYLMRCTVTGRPYTVFGYHGKTGARQYHSADLINCFYEFFQNPRSAEVYTLVAALQQCFDDGIDPHLRRGFGQKAQPHLQGR